MERTNFREGRTSPPAGLLCSLFKCFVSKVIFVFWVFFAVSLAIAVATLFGTRSV